MNHNIYLLKQAWAGLRAKKGFLVTIVSTLGLTMGALLCILTLAYVVILKPLPYPDQESLYQVNSVIVDEERGVLGRAYDYPVLIKLFEEQTFFSQSALIRFEDAVLSSQPAQPTLRATYVTPGWFPMLDINMTKGRFFEQTEEMGSFNPVAILSYETWQNEFNSDPAILDKTVTFGDASYRVVGVQAASFIEPQLAGIGVKTDVYLPWDFNTINLNPRRRDGFGSFSRMSRFIGKLDSPLPVSQVEQTLTTPLHNYWWEHVHTFSGYETWSIEMELQPLREVILGNTQNTVLLLLAGVVGLILIACTNITNLFMSRTADQQRELAIQAAVGASKYQLFKTLFAQSCLVVLIAAAVALVIAYGGFWTLQQYLALRLPRVDELAMNNVTLSAAMLITLLLGLFFARISASMINYQALNGTLQSSGKGTGIQVSPMVRRGLIISQVTMVTLLVFVNIGLLRDSINVINQSLGFETDNIYGMTLKVNSATDLAREEKKPLVLELKKQLMALPEVEDVSHGVLPLNRSRSIMVGPEPQKTVPVGTKYIDDRYFRVIGQPLVEGRYFTEADFEDETPLLIINDVYAKQLLEEGSIEDHIIGSRLYVVNDWRTIVGVVKGVKRPTETNIPIQAYTPSEEAVPQFVIKFKSNQILSREMLATMVQDVSPMFLVAGLESLNAQREQLLFTQYTTAITSSVLAILTFILAAIGLYGILSYGTQMRRFELGTRLAIGAKRRDVILLIVKDNAASVTIGFALSFVLMLTIYIVFSDELASYINTLLVPFFGVTLVLISLMTLFACYWPLRPIINSPPVHSLRGS